MSILQVPSKYYSRLVLLTLTQGIWKYFFWILFLLEHTVATVVALNYITIIDLFLHPAKKFKKAASIRWLYKNKTGVISKFIFNLNRTRNGLNPAYLNAYATRPEFMNL